MNARQYLRFAGELFGLRDTLLEQRVEALLDLAGLEAVDARIGTYSRGMKQRLGVAQALVNAPELLLLDEPTSALDPLGRRDVLTMIAGLRGRTTVFFSTHILADVERVCDTVAILDRGRVLLQEPIETLHARHGGRHRLLVEVDDPARLREAVTGSAWLESVDSRDAGLSLGVADLGAARRDLPAVVAGLGLELRRLEQEETSLEEVFVDLVGAEGDRRGGPPGEVGG
jgi:ABC-2 type transport system ATP-binding protein